MGWGSRLDRACGGDRFRGGLQQRGGGEGQQAEDFEFSMFQGIEEVGFRDRNLARLGGKPLGLYFWAEMPEFQAFYEEFKDQIRLVGIYIGVFTGLAFRNDADALLRELGVTYRAGWIEDGGVPRKFGVTAMPTTVLSAPTARSWRRA